MLKIYVCEDNQEQRDRVTRSISEILDVENYNMEMGLATADPMEILETLKTEKDLGIFFLDIDLNAKINGIELANEIRKYQPRCYIIFVTTHSEMSYMTFTYKVEAMDFIIKDNPSDIKNRIHQCLDNCYRLSDQQSDDVTKNYMVRMGSRVKAVPYTDILFFEVSENARKIILCSKNSKIEFIGKLKDIEKELDKRFYRCHRSILVNKENIEEVDADRGIITLTGGVECPMSVRMRKGLI
ncbi:MAG: response regulator transcription factor [Eubacterium sp.]|nr:response regulator transcription factor [Eubacterium sp.]